MKPKVLYWFGGCPERLTSVLAQRSNSFRAGPDETGHFGIFGGRFVAETLMPLILDLEKHYNAAKTDPAFKAELDNLLAHYAGRPSPSITPSA